MTTHLQTSCFQCLSIILRGCKHHALPACPTRLWRYEGRILNFIYRKTFRSGVNNFYNKSWKTYLHTFILCHSGVSPLQKYKILRTPPNISSNFFRSKKQEAREMLVNPPLGRNYLWNTKTQRHEGFWGSKKQEASIKRNVAKPSLGTKLFMEHKDTKTRRFFRSKKQVSREMLLNPPYEEPNSVFSCFLLLASCFLPLASCQNWAGRSAKKNFVSLCLCVQSKSHQFFFNGYLIFCQLEKMLIFAGEMKERRLWNS